MSKSIQGEFVYIIEADDPLDDTKVHRFGEIFDTYEEAAVILEMALPRAQEIFTSVLGHPMPEIANTVRVGKYVLARCDD